MRVLIVEHDHARYSHLLAEAVPQLDIRSSGDSARLAVEAAGCDVWLGQPDLIASLLRQGHRPAWVQSTWAGITPLLAVPLPRDYRLTRAVGIFGQVMAEYVLAYLLAHEREVLSRLVSQMERRWDDRPGGTLNGRRVLIVGTGDIGQTVARFLSPFGVELVGVAREPRAIAPFTRVVGLDALAAEVAEADYVINLLPDTPETRDLYDAELLRGFKPSAVLVNAGRGSAVVEADLVEALQLGHLAGAVIDVCRQEPLPRQHPFWTGLGLLVTGHSAAPTDPRAMVGLFVDNLQRYGAGEALRGEVDFERGY